MILNISNYSPENQKIHLQLIKFYRFHRFQRPVFHFWNNFHYLLSQYLLNIFLKFNFKYSLISKPLSEQIFHYFYKFKFYNKMFHVSIYKIVILIISCLLFICSRFNAYEVVKCKEVYYLVGEVSLRNMIRMICTPTMNHFAFFLNILFNIRLFFL